MIVYLSVLVSVLGLFIWLASAPPPKPWAEVGRIMFFAGLLAFLIPTAEKLVQVIGKP